MNHPKKPDAGKPVPLRESVEYAEAQRRRQHERDAALTSERPIIMDTHRPPPPRPDPKEKKP